MRTIWYTLAIVFFAISANIQAEEWVDFKADSVIKTMIDVESIKKYPNLVFAVTRKDIGEASFYQTILYACPSQKLYYGSTSGKYPDTSAPPNPRTVEVGTSEDLAFSIHTYCFYSNKDKDDAEFSVLMLRDETEFDTILLRDTEIKDNHVVSWTTRYKVSKKLLTKPKNPQIEPMYIYKTDVSKGYLMSKIDVNCSNKYLKLLASHKYDKVGNVISSMTHPNAAAMETIPKSAGRFIADFLCSLAR